MTTPRVQVTRRGYINVKAEWGNLRKADQRAFQALIAEPDAQGCCAWHGNMRAGCPEWVRIDSASQERIRGQARRLLVQSHNMPLRDVDQVLMTCDNPGCMAWEHVVVHRKQDQRITAEEKRRALVNASGHVPFCKDHSGANFKAYFTRRKHGVVVKFKCRECESHKRHDRDGRGKAFKNLRKDY